MYKQIEYLSKNNSYFQHNRVEMLKFIPKDSKTILEIGCGNGAFGKIVKENIECTYWGVEPNIRFENEANSNLDFFLNDIFNEDLNIPKKHFDVIVFNDVLEHMLYPEDILKICKQFLIPNGVIVSSIPNIRFAPYLYRLFYLGEFEYAEAGIMDKTHFRFFTQKSIKNMYERCGYRIFTNQGINPALQKKFKFLVWIANILTSGKFKDVSFQQIATVAQLK